VLLLGSSAPLIDWAGLGKVFASAAIFALGIVLAMSLAIRLLSYAADRSGPRRTISGLGAVLSLLLVLGAVAFAISIMMKK
jgi:hypothetical protein